MSIDLSLDTVIKNFKKENKQRTNLKKIQKKQVASTNISKPNNFKIALPVIMSLEDNFGRASISILSQTSSPITDFRSKMLQRVIDKKKSKKSASNRENKKK